MSDDPRSQIDPNTVYKEMYDEGRRYRNHEFTSSTWFVALLLGILGFLINTKFGNASSSDRWAAFFTNCTARISVVGLCVFIALASTLLVRACNRRYNDIRDWLDKNLEPEFKTKTFHKTELNYSPLHVFYVTPWLVFVVICVVLYV